MPFQGAVARWIHAHASFKIIAELVQLAIAATVVLRAFGTTKEKEAWFLPSIAAAGCYSCYRLVVVIAERISAGAAKESENTIDDLRARLKVANQEGAARAGLLAIMSQLVEAKTLRVQTVGRENGYKNRRISIAEEALNPPRQINEILQATIRFCQLQLDPADTPKTSFRVAFYLEVGGYLSGMHDAIHSIGPRRSLSSFERHRHHFCLNNDDWPAQAVRCVKENRLLVVSDTVEEEEKGTFRFFRDDQREYLRSLVAFPVSGAVDRRGNPVKASVVIDTDRPGFFTEERWDLLRESMRCLATRLALELSILAIVDER
jgi:hypothetical protein